jgi:hypothetical protein
LHMVREQIQATLFTYMMLLRDGDWVCLNLKIESKMILI